MIYKEMEKCIGCQWNKEGMVCPAYRFCGKSLQEHDTQLISELLDKCEKFYFNIEYENINDSITVINIEDLKMVLNQLKENKNE